MEEYLVTITAQESGIEYFQICKYGIDNSYPTSKKSIVFLIITQLRKCKALTQQQLCVLSSIQ